MKKALVLDPFSGASGDMFLGALVDLGASFDTLKGALLGIPELSRVTMEKQTVSRGVFSAERVKITCPKENAHRSLSAIRDIIEKTGLKDQIKADAIETFTLLARAEAKVHGSDIEEVHFHEVGALDAICDIIGTHVALDLLGNPEGFTRPLALGSGVTNSAHGDIPLPAPATLELLSGYPVKFSELQEELVTPTGAALVASRFRPMGVEGMFIPDSVGYGAGGRDREGLPNVLRAVLGTLEEGARHVCIITSTLDDMNPEVYGYLMEKLFEQGALEVYYNAVMMKKNRPGVEVTLITEEHNAYSLANFLMANTTTHGVRIHREERMELRRRKATVETPFGPIEVKVAERPGGGEIVSPEYESCKKVAEAKNVTLLDVYEAARHAWRQEGPK